MSSESDAIAARLNVEFKNKKCPAFVGPLTRQGKGPKILCFSTGRIPLTADGFGDKKQISVEIVVVDCMQDGYTKVPYECQSGDKYKVDKNALPLSERSPWPGDEDGQMGKLDCYPYTIVEGCPKDKEVRVDDWKWEVHPGMVLRTSFWADAARGGDPKKFRKELCPEGYDEIEAFTPLQVELVCKGWSKWEPGDKREDGKKDREICPVKKGYGMGVGGICVYEGVSLYSMVDRIRKALPCTLDESRTKLQAWQSKFHSIQNLLQTDRGPFFVREASTTTSVDLDVRHDCDGGGGMDDDGSLAERFIRLSGWSLDNNSPESSQVVDIAYSDAISATNCPSIQSACALIELAASAGALSLVVCCNQYRPGKEHILSMLHAYPLIDTALLMRGIQLPIDAVQLRFDETDNYVAFKAGFQVMLPAGMDAATAPKLSSQVAKKRDVGGDGDGDDDGDGDGGSGGEENPSGGDCQDDGDWPEEMQEPLILLSKEAFYCVKGERPLKTPDFMLVESNVQLQQTPGSRAYYVRFVHPILQNRLILWAGYVNMCKPQMIMPELGYNILLAAAAAASAGGGGGGGGGMSRSKSRGSRWMDSRTMFDPFSTSPPSAAAPAVSSSIGRTSSVALPPPSSSKHGASSGGGRSVDHASEHSASSSSSSSGKKKQDSSSSGGSKPKKPKV